MKSRRREFRLERGYLQVPRCLFVERAVGASAVIAISIHAVMGEAVTAEIESGTKTPESQSG